MISGRAADVGVRELYDGPMQLSGRDDGGPDEDDDGEGAELSDENHAALDAIRSGMPTEALVIGRSALDVTEKASPDAEAPNNMPEGTSNSASEYLMEVGKWINDKKRSVLIGLINALVRQSCCIRACSCSRTRDRSMDPRFLTIAGRCR
jgi:hypothetical protein